MARSKQGKHPGTLQYIPTRKHNLDPNTDKIRKLVEALPKGLMAIVANENSRYTSFHAACAALVLPMGARIAFHTGCYVVDSCNRSIQGMSGEEDWIMFMGDDHVFPPMFAITLLTKMYAGDLDIIVPLCFKRSFPPIPVLYEWKNETELQAIDLNKHPEGGLIEVYAAGSAGMIVRKRVLDAIFESKQMPWFELGREQWGEDLMFCKKAQDLGFKVHADLDLSLGHIVNTTIWPVRNEETGEWACQYDFGTQGGINLAL